MRMSEAAVATPSTIEPPRKAMLLGAFLCAVTALWPPAGLAQANPPHPDFSINSDTGWFPVGDDFLPPPSGPGPVTFDKRHPYIDNVIARRTQQQPTFRVADLSNPILQPWAVEQMRKANEEVLAGKVPFRARESCYPGGVPGYLVYNLASKIQFLQTDKEITIINPEGPEVRRIYLNVPHSANVTPSWYGESVGHYEGNDTLIVDTIGLSTKTFVDNYRTPHTDRLHVIERFKLVDAGRMMEVLVTVDDPGAFTMTWSAVQRYTRRQDGPMREAICAENNVDPYGFGVVPTPQADKPDF